MVLNLARWNCLRSSDKQQNAEAEALCFAISTCLLPAAFRLAGFHLPVFQPDPDRAPTEQDCRAASQTREILHATFDIAANSFEIRYLSPPNLSDSDHVSCMTHKVALNTNDSLQGVLSSVIDVVNENLASRFERTGHWLQSVQELVSSIPEKFRVSEFGKAMLMSLELDQSISEFVTSSPEKSARFWEDQTASEAKTSLIVELFQLFSGVRGLPADDHAVLVALIALGLENYGIAELAYAAIKKSKAQSDSTLKLRALMAVVLADARLQRQHLQGFVGLANQAAEVQPDLPAVLTQQALGLMLAQEWEAGLEIWQRRIKATAVFAVDAHLGAAQCSLKLNQPNQAFDYAQSALHEFVKSKSNPLFEADSTQLVAILECYCQTALMTEKTKVIGILSQQFAELFRTDSQLQVLMISALMIEFRFREAAASLEAARKVQPEFIPYKLLLARIYLVQDRAHDAIPLLRECQGLQTREVETLLADALVEANQHAEAADIYQRLAEAEPVQSATYMVLNARVAEQQNDLERAENWYRTAIGGFPDSPFALSEYGAFLTQQKRYDEGVDLLAFFLERFEDYDPGLNNLQTALVLAIQDERFKDNHERFKALLIRLNEKLAELSSPSD